MNSAVATGLPSALPLATAAAPPTGLTGDGFGLAVDAALAGPAFGVFGAQTASSVTSPAIVPPASEQTQPAQAETIAVPTATVPGTDEQSIPSPAHALVQTSVSADLAAGAPLRQVSDSTAIAALPGVLGAQAISMPAAMTAVADANATAGFTACADDARDAAPTSIDPAGGAAATGAPAAQDGADLVAANHAAPRLPEATASTAAALRPAPGKGQSTGEVTQSTASPDAGSVARPAASGASRPISSEGDGNVAERRDPGSTSPETPSLLAGADGWGAAMPGLAGVAAEAIINAAALAPPAAERAIASPRKANADTKSEAVTGKAAMRIIDTPGATTEVQKPVAGAASGDFAALADADAQRVSDAKPVTFDAPRNTAEALATAPKAIAAMTALDVQGPTALMQDALAPGAKMPAAPVAADPVVVARPGEIGHGVGVAIAHRLSAGGEELIVRLAPAELGRIEVRMSFDERGELRAVIAADSAMALDMLRRDSADLSRALSDAGVRSDAQSLRFDSDGEREGGSGSAGSGANQQRNPWADANSARSRATRDSGFSDDADPIAYRTIRTSGSYNLLA